MCLTRALKQAFIHLLIMLTGESLIPDGHQFQKKEKTVLKTEQVQIGNEQRKLCRWRAEDKGRRRWTVRFVCTSSSSNVCVHATSACTKPFTAMLNTFSFALTHKSLLGVPLHCRVHRIDLDQFCLFFLAQLQEKNVSFLLFHLLASEQLVNDRS